MFQKGVINIEEPKKYFLHPGYILASQEPYLIHTVLGSCVAVCLWESEKRFGGMCHFIYSDTFDGEQNTKYGEIAIPHLLKLMLDYGARKSKIKAHIVGGGEHKSFHSPIGEQNATLAKKFIRKNRIEILTLDVGGQFGRKVIFNSGNGEILIYKINEIRKDDWYSYNGNQN